MVHWFQISSDAEKKKDYACENITSSSTERNNNCSIGNPLQLSSTTSSTKVDSIPHFNVGMSCNSLQSDVPISMVQSSLNPFHTMMPNIMLQPQYSGSVQSIFPNTRVNRKATFNSMHNQYANRGFGNDHRINQKFNGLSKKVNIDNANCYINRIVFLVVMIMYSLLDGQYL